MTSDEEVQKVLASFGIDADAPLANHGPKIGITPVIPPTPEELADREACRARQDEREAAHAVLMADQRRATFRPGRRWG
jgi:hypothetical protein